MMHHNRISISTYVLSTPPFNMRHSRHGSFPPLSDGFEDEVFSGGSVVGADPVAGPHQQRPLLGRHILGPRLGHQQLGELPGNKKRFRSQVCISCKSSFFCLIDTKYETKILYLLSLQHKQ